ncbi:MAG: transcriptional repressor [Clostridiales bacterium]|nr:MAG: transcriptional repressor [Clostridiales bacterium]
MDLGGTILDSSELKSILRSKGYKLTPQRRAVLDVLLKGRGQHLTAEEIYDEVRSDCPDIGLATVYRTVQLLSNMKILMKMNLEDGITRYEMNLDEEHHHHHLICESCGKIYEVMDDLLEDVESKVEAEYNFKILDHKLKFYGVCKDCR